MITAVRHNRQFRISRVGFTLTEILVGMAIFLTIMASVTLMFNAVVRTSKIGYQNQTAYQVARGIFNTFENDVTRAFAVRESGHKNTFYGTPYGCTFIGMIDDDNDGITSVARITYVIYASDNAETNVSLRRVYQSTADDNTPAEDRVTYSLLRYIEPGVDNLDSYPIDWNFNIIDVGGNTTLQTVIDDMVSLNTLCDGSPECEEAIARSIKSEFWIRMLAGDDRPVSDNSGNTVSLPRFWGGPTDQRAGFLPSTNQLLRFETLDPADYVLAENILHVRRNSATDGDIFDPNNYDTYDRRDQTFFPYIDALGADTDLPLLDFNDPDYGTEPLPITDFKDYKTANPGVEMPLDYFFTYRDGAETDKLDVNGNQIQKIDIDGALAVDSGGFAVNERVLTYRDFVYWNDRRNLEFDVDVTGQIGARNIVNGLDMIDDQLSTTANLVDPALPESIQLQFVLFYPSPFPGAPDFEKTFTHQINLPTAYRRKQESIETKLLRDIE